MNNSALMRRSLGLAVIGALIGMVAITPAAHAVGVGGPVITGVADGSSVASGFVGPVSVDFSNAPVGTYNMSVSCDTDYVFSVLGGVTYLGDGTDDVQSLPLDAITGPASCELEVYLPESPDNRDLISFSVKAPPLVVDSVSVSPTSFYGYPDTTTIHYRLGGQAADVTARVYNSSGGVVRQVHLGVQNVGRHQWAWHGLRNDGTKVTAGRYRLKITAVADHSVSVSGWVSVLSRPLVLDAAYVSPATFYPRVRDGYRDKTTMHYHLNRAASVTARVLNSAGTTVRRVSVGTASGGYHTWAWSGYANNGTTVGAGAYRIRITAAKDGLTRTVTKSVTVATGWRTKTVHKSRYGDNPTSTSRTTSCYVDYDHTGGSLNLDCWGGSYAQANYGFTIPNNATAIHWNSYGYLASNDIAVGSVSTTGTRTSSAYFRVSVRATDWRSVVITSARVAYTYRYRV